MEERIQKIISGSGLTSRRKAEELIEQGRVKINGRPCKLGDKADPLKDIISVDGENLVIERKKEYTYLMLNKPRGYVTTVSDELGRRCVMNLLEGVDKRVYPIGRLDRNSEGLLLFTNDGAFANSIMHPSCHITKTYRVTVRPDITEEQLIRLESGVTIDGKRTLPASAQVLTKEEGRNRQIRKMCEAVGLEVARLKRTSLGPIKLGMLKPGTFRELTPQELTALRNAINKGMAQNASDSKAGK